MENSITLLSLLADGDFHSGDEIGRQLNISRAAVWKQVVRSRGIGVDIESCHHRGYRVQGGLSLLAEASVRSFLSTEAARCLARLDVLERVSSTNDLAMDWIRRDVGDGYVCLAECQTSGKGRRGRRWVSPFAANIYLSLVKRFEGGAYSVEGLSLAVGLTVVQALESLGYQQLQLKWPNDILWEGRKLGGVLLEIVGDPAGLCDVIVGVGINVNMPASAGDEIDQDWVDLGSIDGRGIDRNAVSGAVISALLLMLSKFERRGFAAYQHQWEALDAFRGEAVVLRVGEQLIAGLARGIDASGALVLETDRGQQSFSGGEISLRRGL